MLLIDRAFGRSEELVCQIHDAIREGAIDRLEELNEELTLSASALSATSQEWLNGLSADLYMLSGQEARFPFRALEPGTQLPAQDALMQAIADRNWENLLRVLRSRELEISEDKRAYFRGRCYGELDMNHAPDLFYAHSVNLAPGNSSYRYIRLSWLAANRPPDARTTAEQFLDDPDTDLATVALAAWSLIRSGIESRREVSGNVVSKAARRFMGIPIMPELAAYPAEVVASTLLIAGYLFELLDKVDIAEPLYRRALSLDPTSHEARDLLRGWGRPDGEIREHSQLARAAEATHNQLQRDLVFAFAL